VLLCCNKQVQNIQIEHQMQSSNLVIQEQESTFETVEIPKTPEAFPFIQRNGFACYLFAVGAGK